MLSLESFQFSSTEVPFVGGNICLESIIYCWRHMILQAIGLPGEQVTDTAGKRTEAHVFGGPWEVGRML